MIWCLGMYASGSTWLFNAVRETAAATGVEMQSCYAETLKMLKPVRRNDGGVKIVKTHQLDAPATEFLTRHATAILLTVRDPRDAVVSLMQYMRHGFATALAQVEHSALFCERFANDPRTHLLRYEGGFIDDITTFSRIAMLLGQNLAPEMRDRLFAASRREAIEARIATLETLPTAVRDKHSGDVVDLESQWHRHHANRSGEVGRWRRMLSPQGIEAVEQRLGHWMERFGYESAATGPLAVSPVE